MPFPYLPREGQDESLFRIDDPFTRNVIRGLNGKNRKVFQRVSI